ncbi:sulfite exporter TauE/SafE family protein [Roseivivax sp. CAU 1761]
MELLSAPVLALAVPAVIFAGISKGGFGSAAAFASASILALILPPGTALGILLPLLMLIDLASLPPFWRRWHWPAVRVLLWGALPGVALGALFYRWADADAVRLLIGLVCLAFVAWQGLVSGGVLRLGARRIGRTGGVLAGVAVGFTSFVSHAGGPPAMVYLLGRGLSKTAFQATTVLLFWAVNLAKAALYAGMGIFTSETLLLDLVLAPFAIFGTWAGVRLHHWLPERAFFAITYVLLTVTGGRLIWDALT